MDNNLERVNASLEKERRFISIFEKALQAEIDHMKKQIAELELKSAGLSMALQRFKELRK